MSVLDQIARGGKFSGLDIVKARVQGARDRMETDSFNQQMQIKAMEMQDYVEKRGREKRLRASLTGADFGDYQTTSAAAQKASDAGEFEKAMAIQKLADAQKGKEKDVFGKMQDIFVGGQRVGVGQYDTEGKLHNLRTTKQMTGDKGLEKPLKPSRASKGQKEEATEYLKRSEYFGEEGMWNVGMSNEDYTRLGSTVASRAQKIMVDAKQMEKSISYIEARDIAVQEVESMGEDIYEGTEAFGGRSLKDEITFKPGISKPLQDFLGISSEATPSGVDMAEFANTYSKLPSGAKYIHPKTGKEMIKK